MLKFECNSSIKEINQKYHFQISSSSDNNDRVFTVGYGNNDEYDSSFFISKDDIKELIHILEESISKDFKDNEEINNINVLPSKPKEINIEEMKKDILNRLDENINNMKK